LDDPNAPLRTYFRDLGLDDAEITWRAEATQPGENGVFELSFAATLKIVCGFDAESEGYHPRSEAALIE
jgi:hypothetical protein